MTEAHFAATMHVAATAALMPVTLPPADARGCDILNAVCVEFNLTPAELKGPRRLSELACARQMFMLLARERAQHLSLPQIGALIRRDHTTVMYGARKAAERVERDEWYAAKRRKILARLAA